MTVEERFWAKVDKSGECWVWTACKNYGYGQFSVGKGKRVRSHRWAYEQERGPIPDGLTIDHLCRNRACVRPSHMEPVTLQVNGLRGYTPVEKPYCANGHPLSGDNIYTRPSRAWRQCRTCRRQWSKEQKARERGRRE